MKKLFSLVAVLMCAVMLSTTAFAANTDPMAVYRKYLKESANLKSADISVTQKMSMTDGSESIDVLKQNISMKMLITGDDKLQMETKTTDTTTKEVSYGYFRNNYFYQQYGDQKFKMKMDMDEALASTANIDVNLTEDILKDATIQVLADGIKITYKTSLNDIKDEQGNSIASMLKSLDMPEDMKMEISTIKTSVTIGFDGTLKSGSNSFGMKVSTDGVQLSFKFTQNFRVNSINSIDRINFPADLSSYQLLKV